MKAVLISIQPKWCEKIASGEKTIEVRKTAPKAPFKCYIYCTKEKKQDDIIWAGAIGDRGKWNGHIIGEFICDKVDEYTFSHYEAEYRVTHVEQKEMCLNQSELIRYGKGKTLYGWHITDLKIYDKPKELNEFAPFCSYKGDFCEQCSNYVEAFGGCCKTLKRPPQSWCYVQELEDNPNVF